MKISLKWLRQYVEMNISPEDLAHRLTMVGLEVEDIEYLGSVYDKFVVGEVLETAKHPKADRLTVCKVNVGSEVLQIVCGAPNVAAGQKVPVGMSGAVVPHNQHDPEGKPFTLAQVKLRGVDSFGMICSASELELGDDKDGIMVFEPTATVGMPLAEYFGKDDIVFEVGITPNRADAMSHFGIAREVAALLDGKFTQPTPVLKESHTEIGNYAQIQVEDSENCPRFSCRVLLNVNIAPSPKWLQEYLSAVGIRPVNNVVDITNYVLMETGQPLHAYDYDTLAGKKIIVKRAQAGEKFVTLDHKERTLTADTLMICDAERSIGVAGVMGGENTEIVNTTKNVLLEGAYFNPRSVRKTAKYLGLSSDASQRFERGANPNITTYAIDRAASLIQELCGAEVLKGMIDIYPAPILPKQIPLRVSRANQLLGTALSRTTVIALLEKIEIKAINATANPTSDEIIFEAPTYRVDLEREIDLIEEVARMYGYDNISTDTTSKFSFSDQPPKKKDFIDEVRQLFIGRGCKEAVVNSMSDLETAQLTSDEVVEVANPISKDMAALRTSLLPGLLHVVRNNIFRGTKDIRMFEIGRVYFKRYFLDDEIVSKTRESFYSQVIETKKLSEKLSIDQNIKLEKQIKILINEQLTKMGYPSHLKFVPGYFEEDKVAIVLSGLANPRHWNEQPRNVTLFDLKGELEAILSNVFLDNYQFISYSTNKSVTDNSLQIQIAGEYAGHIGKIRSDILKKFEIEQDVFVAEISIGMIERHRNNKRFYRPLPKYPSVLRDVAIVLDEEVQLETLTTEIRKVGSALLKQIELFDIYRGNQISAGKKSCAISLEFYSEEQTLTQETVDTVVDTIMKHLIVTLNASLRA